MDSPPRERFRVKNGIKPEINAIAVMMLSFSFVIASLGLYLRSRQK